MEQAHAAPLRLPEQLILSLLNRHGPLSRPALTEITGLPRTTVVATVVGLREKGYVADGQEPADARRAGRPAGQVHITPPATSVALIEMARTGTVLSLAARDGKVLGRVPISATRFQTVAEFGSHVRGGLATIASQIPTDQLVLSLPAPFVPGVGVRYVRRVPVELSDKFPQFEPSSDWLRGDPTEALAAEMKLPVVAENDSNLAAFGEARFGASRGRKSSIFVSLVHGVGAGIVIDDSLYRGAFGVAGELAHVSIDPGGRLCACGNRGCLITAFASGPLLVEQVAEAYQHPLTIQDVIALAAAGDIGVVRILEEYGRTIGDSLAGFVAVFDPGMVVVDGALREAGQAVRDGVQDAIRRRTQPMIGESLAVEVGQLERDSQLLGAVALANRRALLSVLGPYASSLLPH